MRAWPHCIYNACTTGGGNTQAPTLLHFTGSAYINRAMRHEAKKKGGYLSQEGLKFHTTRVKINGKIERTHNGMYPIDRPGQPQQTQTRRGSLLDF